jgi:putative CocE/NonD family hydrolase
LTHVRIVRTSAADRPFAPKTQPVNRGGALTGAIRQVPQLWIPLGDGRRLSARLWLPESDVPSPAILEYLPYRLRDGTAARDATTHAVFAAEGFACVRVDIAGSGDSDGLFDDEYSEREMRDGEQVLAWIADQAWCDGSVGMIGISWGGFNGLQLAARQPPELKAIVTVCSSVDRHADDIHFMGGCLLTDNFNWGAQMTAYMTRPPDPDVRTDWRETWLERIEKLPFLAADWLRHPARDDYWLHNSVCEDFSRLRVPMLAIGGWADAYVNAPFALAEHGGRVAALLGPWEHKYPHLSRIMPSDFHGEVLAWFGRHLAGQSTAAAEPPRIRAYVQDFGEPSPRYGPRAGTWVATKARPSTAQAPLMLHLSPGRLTTAKGGGSVAVATPLSVGSAAAYFCPGMRVDNELAGDQAIDDAQSVCFDTAPLESDLAIVGRPVLELGFRVDRPVAQLCARVCDVAEDGTSRRITYRPFNLCAHRSFERPEFLEPGRLYQARVELNACGHRIIAGHLLRLALSTSYWPVVWPAPEPATVALDLAECRLVLPEWRPEDGVTARFPGPARNYPNLAGDQVSLPKSESRYSAEGGHIVLETHDDFGRFRQAAHGLTTCSAVRQRFSIREGEPTSARHQTEWTFLLERSGWTVGIDSRSVMTCDSHTFQLERHVTATDGGAVALVRSWEERVPRSIL